MNDLDLPSLDSPGFDLPESPVELVALLGATVQRLGSAVWAAETEDDLLVAARGLESARRAQLGVDAQLFTEISDRSAYARDGFTHPILWLAKGLRLGRSEAKRRARRAEKIARLTGMTGETMAPKFPATAAAVAAGTISGAHVDEIADVMRRVPCVVPEDVVARVEEDLAAMATTLTPQELRKAGIALLNYLDPDGALSEERDRSRNRSLSIGAQDIRLMSKLTANLTPTVRAKFELILANWAAPGMNNPDDDPSLRLTGSAADLDTADEVVAERVAQARRRDHRSPEQRNHDALEAMCDFITSRGGLGMGKKIPGQFIVTASIADLKAGCGTALTSTGTLIPVGELVEVAARLDPSLVVFRDHTREVLYYGRARRSATFAQRCALFARDRGDSHPDSDTPFIYTQAHHLPDWAKGGQTDIDKLTATSGRNNRAVGDQPRQWETVYRTSGPHTGCVGWRLRDHPGPPGVLRVNGAHHPDDLARDTIRRIRGSRGKGSAHADPPTDTAASPIETRYCSRLGYTEL
ncbi:DUF222 domain-containing protein [Gordonia crocea]|uniref:DUF222 domain-containing protein n=1 Tax=Gordonia crocea TaxID=589162 RepID=A0A7I9UYL5_9ACTN|nr:DUF222 domain-containing protein [Gordonia crocea]GED98205.1 hypothetical protein nbrc107697_22440 [Gordonia crocea]